MIDIAQKYTNELSLKFADTIHDDKYKFFYEGWSNDYRPQDSTWNGHEFVSIYGNEVIGYIAYSINRNEYDVSNLRIINFTNNKIVFGKDLIKVLNNIFEKYNFRKLSFCVYIGNPIERSYDRFIEKYNGRIVGIKKQDIKLSDGKFYDIKLYEIFRDDYIKAKNHI